MTSPSARAAAEAGTATRDQAIAVAHMAYLSDSETAYWRMAPEPDEITHAEIAACRLALTACLAHLDELARLIAQRDGYATAQSIGPDVALNGWGSKR
jgi:hypothetical protein